MNIPVTQRLELEDGLHKGVIIDIEYRDSPYLYTDVVIEFKKIVDPHDPKLDQAMRLKAGYPTCISEASKLGRLIMRFGTRLEVGKQLDPDKLLIGKPCQFQTTTEETKKGIFARVLPDSVKPV